MVLTDTAAHTGLVHTRRGSVDSWRAPSGATLTMWMPTPTLVCSKVEGKFDVALGRVFLDYIRPHLGKGMIFTGLHDWSAMAGYDTETRKLLTRWMDDHRRDFRRVVIYTESRLVRMGIATAKLVLGSVVEAVGTRTQLQTLIADASR